MVIVILGIVAAMVLPGFATTGDLQGEAAASIIADDLQYAQSHAVTTQSPVTVSFNISGNSYQVSNESGPLIHPMTKDEHMVDFSTRAGFDAVDITATSFSSQSVTFDALGEPDNSGSVTLEAGSFEFRVTVAPVTGKVTVTRVES